MKLQALLLSLIITTGAAMAQVSTTNAVANTNDPHIMTVEEFEKNKAILLLEARVVALEKKVSSLIKIVKMLQARVGTK